MLDQHMSLMRYSWYFAIDLGSHKDHEVKLIKKAISQVKSEYLDITSRVGESQANMTKLK